METCDYIAFCRVPSEGIYFDEPKLFAQNSSAEQQPCEKFCSNLINPETW